MLFYKIASPIGKVIVKSCQPHTCHCYKRFEHLKHMSVGQFMDYQRCKERYNKMQKIKHNKHRHV